MSKGRTQSTTLEFSAARSAPTPSNPDATAFDSKRHVLPKDLPNAIRHLTDEELERLVTAAIAEQKRRGKPRIEIYRPSPKQTSEPQLTTGRLNAVRAAFKAGVKPTQIARQFGLPEAAVRAVLSSLKVKR